MKKKFISMLAMLGAILMFMDIFSPLNQEVYWDQQKYGRIEVQVVDEDTFLPVKEKFALNFYSEEDMRYGVIKRANNLAYTDGSGFFSGFKKPGEYYLYASPELESSKYCVVPNPLYFPETQTYLKIEKGRTTVINKVAFRAGRIKILLVDKKGARVYPIDDFDNFSVREKLKNAYFEDSFTDYSLRIGDLSEGEMIKPMLYPGIYNLELHFTGMGYGSQRVENIKVEKNKTTLVKVVIDLQDNTGVEGRVIDQYNSPVNGVEVEAIQETINIKSGFRQITKVFTDSEGYYKIIGLESDRYRLNFYMNSVDKHIEPDYESIYIDKGMIERLDKSVELIEK